MNLLRKYRLAAIAGFVITWLTTAFCSDREPVDCLAVMVHKSTQTGNISLADLRKMFMGSLNKWPDGTPVVVVEQPAMSPTQQRVLQAMLRMTPTAYNRQLMQEHFQGKQLPVVKVLNSNASAVKYVFNVPGAVAVVDSHAVHIPAGVKILRLNGKLPGEREYPLQ